MSCRIHEDAPNIMAPKVGLDKQTIQFASDHGREAGNHSTDLGNDHLAVRDLALGQVNRIGIVEQLFTVLRKLERRATLQILQLVMLFRPCEPQVQGVSGI